MSQGPQRLFDVFLLLAMPTTVYIWNMKHKERIERERKEEAKKKAEVVPVEQQQESEQDPFHVFEERRKRWAPTGRDDEHDRSVSEHTADESWSRHSPPKIVKLASGKTLSLED